MQGDDFFAFLGIQLFSQILVSEVEAEKSEKASQQEKDLTISIGKYYPVMKYKV